jgi:Radial spokehead-like protein
VNKFVYYVTDNVLGAWSKLPDLLPSDILATRDIKVTFTGNLDRKIFTNPFFFGTEKIYLRAQIARIVQSTTLCPVGLYRTVEDNDKEIEDNTPDEGEIQMPSTVYMSDANNWVHYNQNILKIGRVAHMEPETPEDAPEDFDIEVVKKQIEDADPYEPRLKRITADKKIEVGSGWSGSGAHNL